MKNKKEEILKKVIRQTWTDKPPVDFTTMVMKEVSANTQDEAAINPALKSLLQTYQTVHTSVDFTANVMARIELDHQTVKYKPVISLRSMCAIAASLLITILIILFAGNNKVIPHPDSSTYGIHEVMVYLAAIPPLWGLALVTLSILLLA